MGSIFETQKRNDITSMTFHMQGIQDFYEGRRYQMTLEQAFHAKLGFKQKLWIILQLLIPPKAFARI